MCVSVYACVSVWNVNILLLGHIVVVACALHHINISIGGATDGSIESVSTTNIHATFIEIFRILNDWSKTLNAPLRI